MARLGRFQQLLLLTALLGLMVGLFGAGFTLLWHTVEHGVWHHLTSPRHRIWVSTLAGLIIGLILKWWHDPGSMAAICYHFHRWGMLPMKDNLPIQPVSIVGLVAGQSAGPEGALTQAGGSLGAWLARKTKTPQFTRLLTLAGMGAGFGAFLGAPVGGALLWLEMLHTRGLEYFEAIIPTVVCSCVAFLVMLGLVGHGIVPPWPLDADVQLTAWTPVVAGVIGLGCGLLAWCYAWCFRRVNRLARALHLPIVVHTTLAGLIIGVLGWLVPESYFYGGADMHGLLHTALPLGLAIALLATKMIAASVTIAGRWQGGLIVPNMFMGAIIGKLVAGLVPGLDPTLAMLSCMAAFNAAATQTPLSSAMIVLALTGAAVPVAVFMASIAGFLTGQGVVLIENKQSRTEPANFHLEPVSPQMVP